jgi:chloramphenicol 3-O phosphotransferase
MRSHFFDGFHRCIPAMAAAGNNLIVDHVIEHSAWRTQLAHVQTNRIHEFGPYDMDIDTTAGVSTKHADLVAAAWQAPRSASVLFGRPEG